eukprot:scaffold3017_cov27-Tisochrysis_lutea.AAC.2
MSRGYTASDERPLRNSCFEVCFARGRLSPIGFAMLMARCPGRHVLLPCHRKQATPRGKEARKASCSG